LHFTGLGRSTDTFQSLQALTFLLTPTAMFYFLFSFVFMENQDLSKKTIKIQQYIYIINDFPPDCKRTMKIVDEKRMICMHAQFHVYIFMHCDILQFAQKKEAVTTSHKDVLA